MKDAPSSLLADPALGDVNAKAIRPATEHAEGLQVDVTGDEEMDRKLAAIEMAGEEAAAGYRPRPHEPLAPEVRYLHVSRTIHQLVTDRNRSVGIFLFVASLLFGASTALLNAPERVEPIVPLKAIQYWCLPVTFTVLATIGVFTSLILIRTRIGLIYEATKLNTLLGLPTTRVRRVNPLSIFFLMHALVVVLGGSSAGFAAGMLTYRETGGSPSPALAAGLGVGLAYIAIFQLVYYVTILRTTTETRLQNTRV